MQQLELVQCWREKRTRFRPAGEVIDTTAYDGAALEGDAAAKAFVVARQPTAVTAYVYKPPKLRVRGCGEVLGELPMPSNPDAGVLHTLPRISWLNWVRLALIPAGGDWRDLPKANQPTQAGTLQTRRADQRRRDSRGVSRSVLTFASRGDSRADAGRRSRSRRPSPP